MKRQAVYAHGWKVFVFQYEESWWWRLASKPAWLSPNGPFHCRGCAIADAEEKMKPFEKKRRKQG